MNAEKFLESKGVSMSCDIRTLEVEDLCDLLEQYAQSKEQEIIEKFADWYNDRVSHHEKIYTSNIYDFLDKTK